MTVLLILGDRVSFLATSQKLIDIKIKKIFGMKADIHEPVLKTLPH